MLADPSFIVIQKFHATEACDKFHVPKVGGKEASTKLRENLSLPWYTCTFVAQYFMWDSGVSGMLILEIYCISQLLGLAY